MGWRALLWVGRAVAVDAHSVNAVIGGGTAHTLSGLKGAGVVMAAAGTVELGVVGGWGSAGSKMDSGGGKWRKQ